MTTKDVLALALEALEYAQTGNRRPEIIGAAIDAIKQAQEPVQSEHERIKAFLHKHKANALPDGACKTCEGEGEIGGQFSGGIQECPDCNGSGRAAPKQAEAGHD